jgi:hypothetical protein
MSVDVEVIWLHMILKLNSTCREIWADVTPVFADVDANAARWNGIVAEMAIRHLAIFISKFLCFV